LFTSIDPQETDTLTELIWDGKYKDGKKVAPVRIFLPFQTVETVNETAQERQLTLDMLFSGRETQWRNRLIWGDKKYVLPSLLPEFVGKINLIYIDPPFATGADFSYVATIPKDSDSEDTQSTSFIKEPNIIEQKAYRDTWGRGLDGYLQWFYETVVLLRELLSDEGSIYVHCDWRVSRYIGTVLTEVFGSEALRNEIIWHYSGWRRADNTQFSRKHDTIYHFSKSTERWTYKVISESWVPNYTLEELAKLHILRDAKGDYFISEARFTL
jgi:adenine-specific DNA-methyltransferase